MIYLDIYNAFISIIDLHLLLIIISSTFGGMVIGALPGLTTTMGVALMLPIAFRLPSLKGVSCMISLYCASTFGGSISAILINTPGTPAAAATALDGNPMARKGEAGRALGLALFCSFIGGLVSTLLLSFLAPSISRFALKFGPPEYCALAIFGLTMTAYVSGASLLKGLIAASIGILLATTGLDPIYGVPRLTFGSTYLLGEIGFIPVLIGVFAIPEIFSKMFDQSVIDEIQTKISRVHIPLREIFRNKGLVIRSALIGVFVGAVPATGPDIAAFAAYGVAKQTSSKPDEFGKGNPEGVIAAESANNGCTGGALITGLSIGVPGDAAVAIIMGALMMQGLAPGPLLFQRNAELMYAIFISMFFTQFIMLGAGYIGTSIFIRCLRVPKHILYPTVLVFCVIGSYSVSGKSQDVIFMFIIGFIWFLLSKIGFPSAPVCLGLILGPILELNLRQTILIYGYKAFTIPFHNVVVSFVFVLMIVLMVLPRWLGLLKSKTE